MRRREAGNAPIEFALWLPMVLLALVTCVQLTAALYDARQARDAAEVAVRAQQAGRDPVEAGRAAVPGRTAEVTVEEGEVHVVLPVREVVGWLPASLSTVTGTARSRP